MCKKYGFLLLCMLLLCAFSVAVEGEGNVGSLMSSLDNYPEGMAGDPTKRPEHQAVPGHEEVEGTSGGLKAADDIREESDGEHGNGLTAYEALPKDVEPEEAVDDTVLEPIQIVNRIEEPGQIVEALAGIGAHSIEVTYLAADNEIGRLDVFAECQTPGVSETWYSEIANLEVGQTGVFELPCEGTGEYRVCIVGNDGSGFVVLSISTK